jgi:hypothetical protein
MRMEGFVAAARRNFVPAPMVKKTEQMPELIETEVVDCELASEESGICQESVSTKPNVATVVEEVVLAEKLDAPKETGDIETVDPAGKTEVVVVSLAKDPKKVDSESTAKQPVKEPETQNLVEPAQSVSEEEKVVEAPIATKVNAGTKVITGIKVVSDKKTEEKPTMSLVWREGIDPSYITTAISKYSNVVKDWLKKKNLFETIRSDINKKGGIKPDEFYRNIQNTFYQSLINFMGICRVEKDSVGYKTKTFTEHLATAQFFYTIGINDYMISESDLRALRGKLITDYFSNRAIYRIDAVYNHVPGIEVEWIKDFQARLAAKNGYISVKGRKTISDLIKSVCCDVPERENEIPKPEPESKPEVAEKVETSEKPIPENKVDDDDDQPIRIEIDNDPNSKYDTVTVYGKDETTALTFVIPEARNIPIDQKVKKMVDERNGIWDWLTNLTPHAIFQTSEPDEFISMGPNAKKFIDDISSQDTVKMVILNHDNGIYWIGLYFIDPETLDTTDGDYHIKLVNYLFSTQIRGTLLSQRKKSLATEALYINVASEKEEIEIDETEAGSDTETLKIVEEVVDTESKPEDDRQNDPEVVTIGEAPEEETKDSDVIPVLVR